MKRTIGLLVVIVLFLLAGVLPVMTFGLLSGTLAEEAWGSWDPKTGALITWLLYVVYLHWQQAPALQRYARSAQVGAFVALLVNPLPRLGSILHSYA